MVVSAAGCINIGARLQPEDVSVQALKTGRDCVPIIFGFGFGTVDIELAKRQVDTDPEPGSSEPSPGPITKMRSVELVDRMVPYFGERCIEVTGE